MPNLFGLNIAKLVNDGLASAGGVLDGTLIKVTPGSRTPGSLTGGTQPTTANYAFKGFMETEQDRLPDSLVEENLVMISILGDSVSVVPEVGDNATIEGETYRLVRLMSRDPAAALYEFAAEL